MESKALKHLQRALTLTSRNQSFGARTRASEKLSMPGVIQNDKETLMDMWTVFQSILRISKELEMEQHKDMKTLRDMYGDDDPVPSLQIYLRSEVRVFNKNRNLLSGRLRKPPRIAEQATEGAVAIADYPKDLLDNTSPH